MDWLTRLIDWANENDGLLQALAMLGGAGAIVSSLFWKWRGRAEPDPTPAASMSTPPDLLSLAVLPFVNTSDDPDQEYFADGMAEELIHALAKVPGLRVMSRTSSFSFKGTHSDVATIGAQLNVGAIVEGSVRKFGDRLRVTAQLIEVAGGHHLWSEAFDRPLDDIFDVQDEIAATIVTTIKPKLLADSADPLVTRPTESQEAYELYLRASDRLAQVDRWETRTAIALLRDATELDPNFADAWGRLGHACCHMGFSFDPNQRWQREASAAVDRAFDLDPSNAEASYAKARLLWNPSAGFNHTPALRVLRQALERRPGFHIGRVWQSIIYTHVGLHDLAREGFLEVLEVEPSNVLALSLAGMLIDYEGDHEEAEEFYERSVALGDGSIYNAMLVPMNRLRLGKYDQAERELQESREVLGDDPIVDGNEALLWALRGETERTDLAIARVAEQRPSLGHFHHALHAAAAAHATLGRAGNAIELLSQAAATGLPNYPMFKNDRLLAPLQGQEAMQGLLTSLETEYRGYRNEFGS